ncbi:MAG: hypothetical protein LBG52_04420 [Candidatus Peribacteria bacterium]|jgi:hypothetical protein|nr:hypothetical protein [Candidatus Peribacteria bacterium]
MKRKLFSLKTLIFKPMVSACVFLVVVFLGMVGIFAVNNLTINQIRSTDEPSGKLTADKWDSLVALVNGQATTITTLQNQLTILSGNVANSLNTTSVDIPAGAIWAFDLSACPSGWTRFSAADNRFIMGASSNFKTTGGRSSLTLSTSQLPSHSHYISAN